MMWSVPALRTMIKVHKVIWNNGQFSYKMMLLSIKMETNIVWSIICDIQNLTLVLVVSCVVSTGKVKA
jgi:hypothetical protein